MSAIIETGGKQYLVSKGDKIQVEKLKGEKGETVKFEKVLFTVNGETFELGKPLVSGAVVEGTIVKQDRAKTVEVLKYKAKSKYRRKIGNRQHYTEVEITKA
jgi:large subunit ribosomal protein L21